MGRQPVEVKTVLNVVIDIIHHCVRRRDGTVVVPNE